MAKKKKSKKSRETPSPSFDPESGPGLESPAPEKLEGENAPDHTSSVSRLPFTQDKDSSNTRIDPEDREEDIDSAHYGAVNYLQFEPLTTPTKDPPPTLLLTLIGNFLTECGFNSTSRIFQIELASKIKLDGWEVNLDRKLSSRYPDLVEIFRQQNKEYSREVDEEETSSSSSEDSESDGSPMSETSVGIKKGAIGGHLEEEEDASSSEGSSDASEDSESDSDAETKHISQIFSTAKEREIDADRSSSESTSSDDSSESGVGEEQPSTGQMNPRDLDEQAEIPDTVVDINGATKPISQNDKRSPASQVDTSESEETGVSVSDSEDNEPTHHSTKQNAHTATPSSTDISSSASSSVMESSSDEDETPNHPTKPSRTMSKTTSSDNSSNSGLSDTKRVDPTPSAIINDKVKGRNGSSSSETLQATPVQRISTANTSLSSTAVTSDASAENPISKTSTAKRKRSPSQSGLGEDTYSNKKLRGSFHQNSPFQRVPKDTPIDERFSNKYKSYDYADQAHYDLSVTRGKGFTKEKNKKKRGSYRGGPIDIGGGRGIKFED